MCAGMTGSLVVKGVAAARYKTFVVDEEEWPPRFWKVSLNNFVINLVSHLVSHLWYDILGMLGFEQMRPPQLLPVVKCNFLN